MKCNKRNNGLRSAGRRHSSRQSQNVQYQPDSGFVVQLSDLGYYAIWRESGADVTRWLSEVPRMSEMDALGAAASVSSGEGVMLHIRGITAIARIDLSSAEVHSLVLGH